MRIVSSAVAMQSDRSYYAYEETNTATVSAAEGSNAAILTFSKESRELMEKSSQNRFNNNTVVFPTDREVSITNEQGRDSGVVGAGAGGNIGAGGFVALSQVGTSNAAQGATTGAPSKEDMMLQTLKTLIMAMRRMQMMNAKKGKKVNTAQLDALQKQYERLCERLGKNSTAAPASAGISMNTAVSKVVGVSQNVSGTATLNLAGITPAQTTDVSSGSPRSTVWHRSTVQSVFVKEAEHTAYSAQGMALTADGRQIGFNVSVEMSRAFEAKYESYTEEEYIVTDPLVINLEGDVASVADQKFMFDIDADGHEDEISSLGKGSGFLALDKNSDGIVNDGNELFGAKSGDGFRDLAAYDTDKNGWIDEGDLVFNDLKVWTKDENGNDKLLSLKEANVGAIYLAGNNTEFSLTDEHNNTNAVIRKTGVYLKETGEVGTVQHVDMVL